MTSPLFEISDLVAGPVESSEAILQGISLSVNRGELHAIMGPNGSGKSTLASTLLASPEYEVISGSIRYKGDDIAAWSTDDRARAGMFLAFQYPQEIAGVPMRQFLRQAMGQRKGIADMSILEVRLAMMDWMERLGMDPSFADRCLNEGFSGGEKKRNEILQMSSRGRELSQSRNSMKHNEHGLPRVFSRLERVDNRRLAI